MAKLKDLIKITDNHPYELIYKDLPEHEALRDKLNLIRQGYNTSIDLIKMEFDAINKKRKDELQALKDLVEWKYGIKVLTEPKDKYAVFAIYKEGTINGEKPNIPDFTYMRHSSAFSIVNNVLFHISRSFPDSRHSYYGEAQDKIPQGLINEALAYQIVEHANNPDSVDYPKELKF